MPKRASTPKKRKIATPKKKNIAKDQAQQDSVDILRELDILPDAQSTPSCLPSSRDGSHTVTSTASRILSSTVDTFHPAPPSILSGLSSLYSTLPSTVATFHPASPSILSGLPLAYSTSTLPCTMDNFNSDDSLFSCAVPSCFPGSRPTPTNPNFFPPSVPTGTYLSNHSYPPIQFDSAARRLPSPSPSLSSTLDPDDGSCIQVMFVYLCVCTKSMSLYIVNP